MNYIKVLLLILNLLFFIYGLSLIGASVTMDMDQNVKTLPDPKDMSTSKSVSIIAISIGVTGTVAIVVSCIGCGGIFKEINFIVVTYAVFMSLFLLIQVVLALQFAHIRRYEVRRSVLDGLEKWMSSYNDESFEGEEVRKAWDEIQVKLQCCGIQNYTDWQSITIPRKKGVVSRPLVPHSCCRSNPDDLTVVQRCAEHIDFRRPVESSARIFTEGCLEKVVEDYRDLSFGVIGWALLCVPVIEFLAFFFACLLSYKILHGDEEEDDIDCRRRPSEYCFYPQIAEV